MPNDKNCPAERELEHLMLGLLPDREAERLEHHLLNCPSCIESLSRIRPQDTLTIALKSEITAVDADPPTAQVIEGLIDRLTQAGLASSGDTPSAAGGLVTRTWGKPGRFEPAQATGVAASAFPFLAPPQAADELGRLGGYRIIKVLGKGGMGIVFQAEDVQLLRMVALKALLPGLADAQSYRERFLREARTAAAIQHDHIVTIFQVGEDRGVPYLAMPLLAGETLDQRIQRTGAWKLRDVLRIGREIALGLAAAHDGGLVHRDIKPPNIWLEGDRGRVKILDFGLARTIDDDTNLTQTGAVVGTPGYMAPEQVNGQAVDSRCDLFALGCILHRLCVGRLPFTTTGTLDYLASLARDVPPPLSKLSANIPRPLSDLVARMLAKNPAARPRSAREVVEAIRAIEQSRSRKTESPARPLDAVGRERAELPSPAAVDPAAEPVDEEPRPDDAHGSTLLPPLSVGEAQSAVRRRGVRRNPLWAAGGFGAAVLALVLVVAYTNNDRPEQIARVEPTALTNDENPPLPRQIVAPSPTASFALPPTPILSEQDVESAMLFQSTIDPDITLAPSPAIAPGDPFDQFALVTNPPPLDGIETWTVETVHPRGAIHAAAFRPDGQELATLGDDGTIRFFSVHGGALDRAVVSGSVPSSSSAVDWSPGGTYFAVVDTQDRLKVWDAQRGSLCYSQPTELAAACVDWSPDGASIAVAGRNGLSIWDAAAGQQQADLDRNVANPRRLAWSPDSKRIALARDRIDVWDVESKSQVASLGAEVRVSGSIHALDWSPDGTRLAFADRERTEIWNAATGEQLPILDSGCGESGLAWSPDGKFLAVGDKLLDADSYTVVHTLDGHGQFTAWSPDSSKLASGGAVYDRSTGKRLWSDEPPAPITFSFDSKTAAMSRGASGIRLVNAATGRLTADLLPLLTEHDPAVSPDGHVGGSNGTREGIVYIVQTNEGQETLKPDEFEARFGWQNDAARVEPLAP